jgi:hypothetical protein
MDLTKEQRILNANQELLAAFAWERYQKEGRGMVVVPEDDFVHLPTPTLKGLRFAYAAKDGDLLGTVSKHFADVMRQDDARQRSGPWGSIRRPWEPRDGSPTATREARPVGAPSDRPGRGPGQPDRSDQAIQSGDPI